MSGESTRTLPPTFIQTSPARAVKILLVDDNPGNLLALTAAVEAPGFEIAMAQSGMEAIERAQHEQFAAILLDVRMPVMDGLETARILRSGGRNQQTPILFLTADERDSELSKAYELGAIDFLTKPIRPAILRSKLSVLGQLARAAENLRDLNERTRLLGEQQLMLLVEASASLLASPHSADVVHRIMSLAQRFVAADGHAIWRRQEQTGEWERIASHGLTDHYDSSVKDGGHTILLLEPLAIEDVEREPMLAARQDIYRAEGIRSLLVVPVSIHGRLAGTISFYYRATHGFTDAEIAVASALANLAGAALGTAELYDREQSLRARAEEDKTRFSFLARAGEVLGSSLDFETTLRNVAELAVPTFADWCGVDILNTAGKIERLAVKHRDPAKVQLAIEIVKRYPPRDSDPSSIALTTGEGFMIAEIPDSAIDDRAQSGEHARMIRALGLRSYIVSPLVARGRVLGALAFATAESGRRYTETDFELTKELARRAAAAVDNARMHQNAVTREEQLRTLFVQVSEEQEKTQQTLEILQYTNEELRRANADLEQFAYSASHDLQEPLRMISIYTEMLQRDYADRLDNGAQQYMDFAIEGALRMERLLKDLRAYLEVATHADQPPLASNASAILQQTITGLMVAIRGSGAHITSDDLPEVQVRDVHLQQLFQNLIGNAIKYRQRDTVPEIHVTAAEEQGYWRFAVRDNGIGFDPEYATKIFGVFKRLHARAEYEGTGIGLAICQRIVERYGGRIWAQSQPGQGSIFFFTLPRRESDVTPISIVSTGTGCDCRK